MPEARDEEIYPNSPLIDVACEIRFPGELRVECERHVFWEKIREEYPAVLVPHAEAGQPLALRHYRFRNVEKSRVVMVTLHSLVVSESKYSGHATFIKEFSRILGVFRSCFPDVNKLNRIGWRYVNRIPFTREDGLIPIRRFIDAQVSLPDPIMSAVKEVDIGFQVRTAQGDSQIRVATASKPDSSDEAAPDALIVDLDFSVRREDLTIANCLKEIETIRKHNRELFERLITDDYREYLRGKSL